MVTGTTLLRVWEYIYTSTLLYSTHSQVLMRGGGGGGVGCGVTFFFLTYRKVKPYMHMSVHGHKMKNEKKKKTTGRGKRRGWRFVGYIQYCDVFLKSKERERESRIDRHIARW